MNTWKTSIAVRGSKLRRAISLLELLRDERNALILQFLNRLPAASLQDMVVFSGHEPSLLEDLLEDLCQANLVASADTILGTRYSLNYHRLAKIKNALASLHH